MPVSFGISPVRGICGRDEVFVVAAGAAGCGSVAGATNAAGTAGGLAAGNAGKSLSCSWCYNLSCLTASG